MDPDACWQLIADALNETMDNKPAPDFQAAADSLSDMIQWIKKGCSPPMVAKAMGLTNDGFFAMLVMMQLGSGEL